LSKTSPKPNKQPDVIAGTSNPALAIASATRHLTALGHKVFREISRRHFVRTYFVGTTTLQQGICSFWVFMGVFLAGHMGVYGCKYG